VALQRPRLALGRRRFLSSASTNFRLGILNASMREDVFGFFKENFRQADAGIEAIDYRTWEKKLPQRLTECDGYLVTGSAAGVYEQDKHPWILPLHEFVRKLLSDELTTSPRLVGVCFGHQCAAFVANGNTGVAKSPKGWGVGIKPMRVIQQRSFMQPFKPQVSLLYSHQDQVEKLPPNTTLLGTSDFCPNEMLLIRHPNSGIAKAFTFQPHNDYPRRVGRELYTMRRERIDANEPGRTDRALQSLDERFPSDEILVTRWAARFLRDGDTVA